MSDVELGGLGQIFKKYQSHKIVQAAKIAEVRSADGDGLTLFFLGDGDSTLHLEVDADYVRKHSPVAGGYFVLYADGYKSFSPADAFEGGYTALPEEAEAQPVAPEAPAEAPAPEAAPVAEAQPEAPAPVDPSPSTETAV